MSQPSVNDRTLPTIDAGVTVVQTPHQRSGAIHHLALATADRTDGPAYWIDACNTAITHALYDHAATDHVLHRVRIARAFTAYQHHTLVDRVLNRVSTETGCVIVPNVASLYRDDDIPDYEAKSLLAAAMQRLGEIGLTFDVPVLTTDGGPDDAFAEIVRESAMTEMQCERTELGYRYEGPDFETDVYWADQYWQTTIPYWVSLLGAVDDRPTRSLTGPALQFAVEG